MKIAVIGVGTGGLISLSHFCGWSPSDWEIYSIHDPNTKILGIGESTTPAIPECLFYGTDFKISQDASELDATIKHYVKYVNWRRNDIDSLINTGLHAMHFNNFKLKDFVFKRLRQIWGNKFKVIEGNVNSMVNGDSGVWTIVNGQQHIFDYVIDCRGFPKDYSEYELSAHIPVNHCLVNMIPEKGEWDFTYHTATKNGWMFGIPLTTRQGWGYLFNDTITTIDDAVDDIAEIFKTSPDKLDLREFTFKNYYSKKILNNRIIKNGNAAMFFEPLEALSGFYYDRVNRYFYDYIVGDVSEDEVNEYFLDFALHIEVFISYIYHGGSIYNTPFWEITKQDTTSFLKSSSIFANIVEDLRSISQVNKNFGGFIAPFAPHSWFKFDKNFGYNYFSGA